MTAAAAAVDDVDVALLSSQERHQNPKTKKARDRVGKEFDEYIAAHGGNFSLALFKEFLHNKASSIAPTTLWTHRSHLLRYIRRKYKVLLSKTDLITLTEYMSTLSSGHVKTKALALTREEILKYLNEAPSEGVHLRTKIALVVGVFSLGRIEEVSQLEWKDITFCDKHIIVELSRCKTTAERSAQSFSIPNTLGSVDIRALITKYKEVIGEGPMWRSFSNNRWGTTALGKSTLAETPRTVASYLDLPAAARYTGHGLRASGASFMVESGASSIELMNAGNWSSITVAEGYVRDSEAQQQRRCQQIAGFLAQPQAPQPQAPQPQPPQLQAPQLPMVFNRCVFNITYAPH
jgi:integrase